MRTVLRCGCNLAKFDDNEHRHIISKKIPVVAVYTIYTSFFSRCLTIYAIIFALLSMYKLPLYAHQTLLLMLILFMHTYAPAQTHKHQPHTHTHPHTNYPTNNTAPLVRPADDITTLFNMQKYSIVSSQAPVRRPAQQRPRHRLRLQLQLRPRPRRPPHRPAVAAAAAEVEPAAAPARPRPATITRTMAPAEAAAEASEAEWAPVSATAVLARQRAPAARHLIDRRCKLWALTSSGIGFKANIIIR